MDNIAQRLAAINSKTKKIIEKNDLLQKENVTLSELNSSLKSQITDHNQHIFELKERLKVQKLAKSISGEENAPEKTELKRKINEYIKEVDKCIALLNE